MHPNLMLVDAEPLKVALNYCPDTTLFIMNMLHAQTLQY